MKYVHKILLVAVLAIAGLGVYACVTPEQTQRIATVHQEFDTTKQDISTQLANGTITSEQATQLLSAAVAKLADDLSAVAKDVKNSTSDWFDPQRLIEIGLGSLLTGVVTHKTVNASRDAARVARGERVGPLGPKTGSATGSHTA